MRAARGEGYIKVSAASTTSLQRSRQQHRSPEKQGRIWKKEKKMKKERGVVAEPKMVLMKENGVETDPTRRRGRNGNREKQQQQGRPGGGINDSALLHNRLRR